MFPNLFTKRKYNRPITRKTIKENVLHKTILNKNKKTKFKIDLLGSISTTKNLNIDPFPTPMLD